ncbi:MAG: hypothetical protein ACI4MM_07550 [Candidatus Ventricola sp.]
MAKRREQPENLEQTKRISPYQQIDDSYDDGDQDMPDEVYDDAYADEYGYDDEDGEEAQAGGFFSAKLGKIAAAVIVLLLVVLLGLTAVRLLGNTQEAQQLPSAGDSLEPSGEDPEEDSAAAWAENTPEPDAQTPTPAPTAVVFAPVISAEETPEPAVESTQRPTAEPTEVPEPTATPLPIILTNTPTPSPSPTPTPTPTPTPVPTSTPEPTPTPLAEIGKGEVNRNANLRATASSSGKIKQTVKKGESVTIHETLLDKTGKLWYSLTVDDESVSGYMRDYVVDLEGQIAKPTATPKPEAETISADEADAETAPAEDVQQVPADDVIAAGKANRDANIRKVMNGTVLGTVKKGKTVSIYEVLKDKSGNVWYRLSVDESSQAGYMRDYVIDLDDEDAKLEVVTDAEKASVGTAKTNRAANVRKTPVSNGKVVRQLSEGVKVYIMGKYEDSYGQIWYEISTESGNTKGFMRDYVLDSVKLNDGVETKTYTQ